MLIQAGFLYGEPRIGYLAGRSALGAEDLRLSRGIGQVALDAVAVNDAAAVLSANRARGAVLDSLGDRGPFAPAAIFRAT